MLDFEQRLQNIEVGRVAQFKRARSVSRSVANESLMPLETSTPIAEPRGSSRFRISIHSILPLAIVGFTAMGFAGVVVANQAVCVDEEDTYISSGRAIDYGKVRAEHPCNIEYAQTLPPGDLRVGGGVTLNSPEEVAWYLWRDAGLLNLKAGGNVRLRDRLHAGSTNQRQFLRESDWDINAIDVDNVIGRMPLWHTTQFVIDDNSEHEAEILRQFAQKGIRVEFQEGWGQVLTGGVAGQDIVDPRNPNRRLFVLVKIVEQAKQNLNRFLFGNEEPYWVLRQIQQMDDGRIRKLYSFIRNDCINAMLFTIKLEILPTGEVIITLTQTPVPPAVPTQEVPPLVLTVPGVVLPTVPPPPPPAETATTAPTQEVTATTQTVLPSSTPPSETRTAQPTPPSPTTRPDITAQPTPRPATSVPTARPNITPSGMNDEQIRYAGIYQLYV